MANLRDNILSRWYNVLTDLVNDNSVSIIYGREDGHRPPKPYIVMELIAGGSTNGGFDDVRKKTTNNADYYISGTRQYTLNLQAFGGDSMFLLDKIMTLLDKPNISESLQDANVDISIVNRGEITDISQLLETSIEARYSLDIIFNAAVNETVTIGTIGTVDIDGILQGIDDILIDDQITDV